MGRFIFDSNQTHNCKWKSAGVWCRLYLSVTPLSAWVKPRASPASPEPYSAPFSLFRQMHAMITIWELHELEEEEEEVVARVPETDASRALGFCALWLLTRDRNAAPLLWWLIKQMTITWTKPHSKSNTRSLTELNVHKMFHHAQNRVDFYSPITRYAINVSYDAFSYSHE